MTTNGIPILRQTATYATDRDTYTVRTFRLVDHWFYCLVFTSAGGFLPGITRHHCYAETPKLARYGAWREIEKFERSQRVCDFGDGRAA